ncbi:MAG: PQQ-binding-like beta-propeller repeat protein [Gemmataceae bacterium]
MVASSATESELSFRYPRSRKADTNRSSDPSPAVFSCGRVFVAPADADRVYALDPESGRVLWESGSTEGAQILGVAAGKLIVTVTGPISGLRAMSVITGFQREPEGCTRHSWLA